MASILLSEPQCPTPGHAWLFGNDQMSDCLLEFQVDEEVDAGEWDGGSMLGWHSVAHLHTQTAGHQAQTHSGSTPHAKLLRKLSSEA